MTPRVFVSYTHDSAEHKESVATLAVLLRANGVDARTDRWDTDRRRDWYVWAMENITAADYILVVASDTYRRMADGVGPSTGNRGGRSEAALLRELVHSERDRWLPRMLPVLLPGYRAEHIPLFLQPRTADHYKVRELTVAGVEDLLRVLTEQPAYPLPPLGSLPVLPPRE